MEGTVFPAPAVAEILIERYIEARLHTDGGPAMEENQRLQAEMTGSRANPIYVLFDPVLEKPLGQREGYVLEKDFVEFLKSK
jgi:hypothetical protein